MLAFTDRPKAKEYKIVLKTKETTGTIQNSRPMGLAPMLGALGSAAMMKMQNRWVASIIAGRANTPKPLLLHPSAIP